jgi:putative Ca2+/H+ antiporter (TMEM165/GDT1 family)
MNWPAFLTIFSSVFVAELGDKTQLSTLLFASDARHSRWTVFLAASLALITTSALGVLAGSLLGKSLSPTVLRYLAGLGFIAIGLYTLLRHD